MDFYLGPESCAASCRAFVIHLSALDYHYSPFTIATTIISVIEIQPSQNILRLPEKDPQYFLIGVLYTAGVANSMN